MKLREQNGFTLVELAIVMIVIGLLIGGVLKGQELITNAQITRVVADVKAFKTAFNTFRGVYDEIPGDMPTANRRLPGCAADPFCLDGDGNGEIGFWHREAHTYTQAGTIAMPRAETSMFWKHLALVDMIGGVNAGANPTTPAWGETHPVSSRIGGYGVYFAPGTSNSTGTGNKIRWSNHITGTIPFVTRDAHVINPIRAQNLDIKIDDGRYETGDVTTDSEGGGCGRGDFSYRNTTQRNCIMYFSLD